MRVASLGLLCLVAGSPPADAPPLQLGPLRTFASEAAAIRGCPGDVVVWADRATGFFYPRSRSQYGHTPSGAYACYRAAKAADYWDINPFATLGAGKAGRDFPIDPDLLDWGS